MHIHKESCWDVLRTSQDNFLSIWYVFLYSSKDIYLSPLLVISACSLLCFSGFTTCVLIERSILFVHSTVLLQCRPRRAQESIRSYMYGLAVGLHHLIIPSGEYYRGISRILHAAWFAFFLFCIRFIWLDELAEFNWNQSTMTVA